MEISFVAPAYNEAQNIEKNIEIIRAFAKKNFREFEIILVDDGSTDGTWSILQRLQSKELIVDRNPKNMGPGAAFRRGFLKARGDVVVTLESDLSYPVEDTLKLVQKLTEGYGVAIASPFIGGAGYAHAPALRVMLSKFGTLLYTLVLGQRLSTYTGFFRAYKKNILQQIKLESDGFESQVELVWKARRLGAKFAEVPSFQTYDASRPSKFKIVRELGRHLAFLLFRVVPGQILYFVNGG